MASSFDIYGNLEVRTQRAKRQLDRFIKKAESRKINLEINDRKFTQPLGRITGAASEFNKSLEASNARVLAFGASAGLIYGMTRAFTEMVTTTVKVEKSLAEINVILNASSGNLKKFGSSLFDIAAKTGQAFDEVAKSATELSRQGLGVSETLKRTENAMILMRLSGMNAKEAVDALTAAMNSFQSVTLNTTQIVNKMAKVDAAFAVSTNDLAKAISRVGSSAEDAGVNFDKLLAATAALQQTTARGGAVIGNSLKTIFTRIKRTEVIDQLRELGINVKNASGEMKPAMGVLKEFSKSFDTLSAAEKAHMTELMGGVFQMNILRALLKDLKKDYSFYDQALRSATSATNEAIKRNKELNKTMAAMVNESLQNLTKLGAALGELTIAPALKAVMKEFNSMFGEGGQGPFKHLKELTLAINPKWDTKGVDDASKKFGKGLLEGLGRFIEGPGLAILGGILIKLTATLTGFALKSGKELMSTWSTLGKKTQEYAKLQEQVSLTLRQQPDFIKQIYSGTLRVEDAEKKILALLRQQAKERERLRLLTGGLTTNLQKQGAYVAQDKGAGTASLAVGRRDKVTRTPFGFRAGGYVPNAGEKLSEITHAAMGGYSVSPEQVKKAKLPGMKKPVVFNDREQLSLVAGKAMISPPRGTEAASLHRREAEKKLGINPYAGKGFVPNFFPGRIPGRGGTTAAGANAITTYESALGLKGGAANLEDFRIAIQRQAAMAGGTNVGNTLRAAEVRVDRALKAGKISASDANLLKTDIGTIKAGGVTGTTRARRQAKKDTEAKKKAKTIGTNYWMLTSEQGQSAQRTSSGHAGIHFGYNLAGWKNQGKGKDFQSLLGQHLDPAFAKMWKSMFSGLGIGAKVPKIESLSQYAGVESMSGSLFDGMIKAAVVKSTKATNDVSKHGLDILNVDNKAITKLFDVKGVKPGQAGDLKLKHGGAGSQFSAQLLDDLIMSDKKGVLASRLQGTKVKDAQNLIKSAGQTLAARKQSVASGYVPNFSALGDAFKREKKATGLPASEIYSTNVAGLGTVVANNRDEPTRSALMKNIKDHPAPAFAGMVPNFARKKIWTGRPPDERRAMGYRGLREGVRLSDAAPHPLRTGINPKHLALSMPHQNPSYAPGAFGLHMPNPTSGFYGGKGAASYKVGTGASASPGALKGAWSSTALVSQAMMQSQSMKLRERQVGPKGGISWGASSAPALKNLQELSSHIKTMGAAGTGAAKHLTGLQSAMKLHVKQFREGHSHLEHTLLQGVRAAHSFSEPVSVLQTRMREAGKFAGVAEKNLTALQNRIFFAGEAAKKSAASMAAGAMGVPKQTLRQQTLNSAMAAQIGSGAAVGVGHKSAWMQSQMAGLGPGAAGQLSKFGMTPQYKGPGLMLNEKLAITDQQLRVVNAHVAGMEAAFRKGGKFTQSMAVKLGTLFDKIGIEDATQRAIVSHVQKRESLYKQVLQAEKEKLLASQKETRAAQRAAALREQNIQRFGHDKGTMAANPLAPRGALKGGVGAAINQASSVLMPTPGHGGAGGAKMTRVDVNALARHMPMMATPAFTTAKQHFDPKGMYSSGAALKQHMGGAMAGSGAMASAFTLQKQFQGTALTNQQIQKINAEFGKIHSGLMKGKVLNDQTVFEFTRFLQGQKIGNAEQQEIIAALRMHSQTVQQHVVTAQQSLMAEKVEAAENKKQAEIERRATVTQNKLDLINKLQLQTEEGILAALKRRLGSISALVGPGATSQLTTMAGQGGQVGQAATAALQQGKAMGQQRMMMGAMTASMVAPMVTSAVAQFKKDKVEKARWEAGGDVAMYGGMGAFFGAGGAAAGVALGGMMGANKIFRAMIDTSDTLNQKFEESQEKLTNFNDGVSKLIQATDKLNEGMLDPDISPDELQRREGLQMAAFEKIPAEWRDDITAVAGDRDQLLTLTEQIRLNTARLVTLTEQRRDLAKGQEETRSMWQTMSKGKGLGGAIESITGSDHWLTGIVKEIGIGLALSALAATGVGSVAAGGIAAARYGKKAYNLKKAYSASRVVGTSRHLERGGRVSLNAAKGGAIRGATRGAKSLTGIALGTGAATGMSALGMGIGDEEYDSLARAMWTGDNERVRELSRKYQGQMFDDTEMGKIKLEETAKGFVQNLELLQWFKDKTDAEIEKFQNLAKGKGAGDYEALTEAFKQMGLNADAIKNLSGFFQGRDAGEGVKDIPKLIKELMVVFPEGKKLRDSFKTYQKIIAETQATRDLLIRTERNTADAIRSLGITIEREINSMLSDLQARDSNLGKLNQARRQSILSFTQSGTKLMSPFMTDETQSRLGYRSGLAAADMKTVNAFQNRQSKGRQEILSGLQKDLTGFFNNLTKIYRDQETRGESPSQRKTEINKLTRQRDVLVKLFDDVSREFATDEYSGPEQIISRLRNLQTDPTFQGNRDLIENIITQVETTGNKNQHTLEQILIENKIQRDVLEKQKDMQLEQIALDKRLGSMGGIGRFKSGERLNTNPMLLDFLTSRTMDQNAPTKFERSTGAKIFQGRSSLQFLNMMKGNLPGNISDWVRGGGREGSMMAPFIQNAVQGRAALINQDLGSLSELMRSVGGGPGADAGKLLGGTSVNQIAREQIAAELEVEDMAGNIKGIKDGIAMLNRLNSFEMQQFEDKNKRAFKEALQEVRIVEAVEGTTTEVGEHARFEGVKLDLIAQLLEAQRQIAQKDKVFRAEKAEENRISGLQQAQANKLTTAKTAAAKAQADLDKTDYDPKKVAAAKKAHVKAIFGQFGSNRQELTDSQLSLFTQGDLWEGMVELSKGNWKPGNAGAKGTKALSKGFNFMTGNFWQSQLNAEGRGGNDHFNNALKAFYDNDLGLKFAQIIDKHAEGKAGTGDGKLARLWSKAFMVDAGPGVSGGKVKSVEQINWDAFGEFANTIDAVRKAYGDANFKNRFELLGHPDLMKNSGLSQNAAAKAMGLFDRGARGASHMGGSVHRELKARFPSLGQDALSYRNPHYLKGYTQNQFPPNADRRPDVVGRNLAGMFTMPKDDAGKAINIASPFKSDAQGGGGGLLQVAQTQSLAKLAEREKLEKQAQVEARKVLDIEKAKVNATQKEKETLDEQLKVAKERLEKAKKALENVPTAAEIKAQWKKEKSVIQEEYRRKAKQQSERDRALAEIGLTPQTGKVPYRNISRSLLMGGQFNLTPFMSGTAGGLGGASTANALSPIKERLSGVMGSDFAISHGGKETGAVLKILQEQMSVYGSTISEANKKISENLQRIEFINKGWEGEPMDPNTPALIETLKKEIVGAQNVISSNERLISGLDAVTDALQVNQGAGALAQRLSGNVTPTQLGLGALSFRGKSNEQYQAWLQGNKVAREKALAKMAGIEDYGTIENVTKKEELQAKLDERLKWGPGRQRPATTKIDPATGTPIHVPGETYDEYMKRKNAWGAENQKIKNQISGIKTPTGDQMALYRQNLANDPSLKAMRQYQQLDLSKVTPGYVAEQRDKAQELGEEQQTANLQASFEVIRRETYAFGESISAAADALTENNIKFKKYGMKDFIRSMRSELTKTPQDFYRELDKLGRGVTQKLRTGLADVFYNALDGTKKLREGFKDLFDEIGNMITKTLIQMAVDKFIFAPAGLQAPQGAKGGSVGRGRIGRYASGGPVVGGSGVRDDVPAMLTRGEYVIKKSSVQKYGMDFLDKLNNHGILRAARGQMVLEKARDTLLKQSAGKSPDPQAGLTSMTNTGNRSTRSILRNAFIYDDNNYATAKGSKFEIDRRLSRFSLIDENNPQNEFRIRKQAGLYDYEKSVRQQQENYLTQIEEWKKSKKARRKKAYTSAAIALTMGLAEGNQLFSGNIKQNYGYRLGKGIMGIPGRVTSGIGSGMKWGAGKVGGWFAGGGGRFGGQVSRMAQGGLSPDNVPALLMGGEYVISKQAVSRHGKAFFDKLNEGSLPRFEKGGYVSENSSPQSFVGGGSQEISNNINVTVNMSSDGEGSVNTETQYDNNREEGNNLGEVIKDVVVKTIIEQTRQGGVLGSFQRKNA